MKSPQALTHADLDGYLRPLRLMSYARFHRNYRPPVLSPEQQRVMAGMLAATFPAPWPHHN